MPIIEYTCLKCGHHFERLQNTTAEKQLAECPECDSNDVMKDISAFSAAGGASPVACNSGGG